VQPHDHQHVLGVFRNATADDARRPSTPPRRPHPDGATCRSTTARRSCSGRRPARRSVASAPERRHDARPVEDGVPGRDRRACELIDFWRFNVHYARQILAEQPIANSPGIWNRTDHRPLEGFVYAITPFNFTAIAGNLPTAPALMGNTVVWKPSPTQQLAASLTMELLEEAGMPPGVINMLPGDGLEVSKVALTTRPGRHPLHRLDADLPAPVAHRRREHRVVPLLPADRRRDRRQGLRRRPPVGRPRRARVALIRGSFEYQGQKCSAASRAYVARSVWAEMGDAVRRRRRGLAMGDVTDLSNFMGAVIDDRAFAKHKDAIDRAHARQPPRPSSPAGRTTTRSAGSSGRRSCVSDDPTDEMFRPSTSARSSRSTSTTTRSSSGRAQMESFAPYALTGSIIAQDRAAGDRLSQRRSGSRPATSTSTTSPPAPSSASSRSVGAGVRHQRQGRRRGQPAALDLPALDQGDVRPPDRPPLPAHALVSRVRGTGKRKPN
jgi:1-pyrroline-5-carboxylate dehydrogenase